MTHRTSANSATELFSRDNLSRMDETVREVFGTMLGMEVKGCLRPSSLPQMSPRGGEHTAHIAFAGTLCGHCEIQLSRHASAAIASAMLGGADIDADSDDICDAIGELCNMLAGGWKDRLPALSADCHLSIPVPTCDLHQHRPVDLPLYAMAPLDISRRSYTFGNQHTLTLTLARRRGA